MASGQIPAFNGDSSQPGLDVNQPIPRFSYSLSANQNHRKS